MTRENLLFSIIGLLAGFIVGFMFASSMAQRQANPATASTTRNLPADHPPIGGSGQDQQQVFAEVQASMKKAREEPQNFEAQVAAARLEFRIQRYDEAIGFLLKANQLRPADFDVVAMLGDANLQAGNHDAALKWYKAALMKQPTEVSILASLAFTYLEKGDPGEAEKAIAELEKVDASSEDIPRFRQRLAALKGGEKSP